MVKQILHGNMNTYFYVDNIATMFTASPDNVYDFPFLLNTMFTASPDNVFVFPFLLKWRHKMVRLSKTLISADKTQMLLDIK